MKKSILLLSAFAIMSTVTYAKKVKKDQKETTTQKVEKVVAAPTKNAPIPSPAPQAQPSTPNQNPDLNMKFTTEEHNFGTVPEGPAITHDFEFKNIGKEPIVLSGVQASCGCTTPTWSKEPIAPGKTGKVSATYNTQGRPGNFTKTITINSNVGTKVVKITGIVEKAPESSVPTNNNSMMKH